MLGYAAVALYYRYRPQPAGLNGRGGSYRVPSSAIGLLHDSTWYEGSERRTHREIVPQVQTLIRNARRFVLLDVFLFNQHHAEDGPSEPTTRRIASELAAKSCPRWFITDPLNVSYGTARCLPLEWLQTGGTQVCLTELRRLRDNNLPYAPLWRLVLSWFGTGSKRGWLRHPLEPGRRTTLRAYLEAFTVRANHRKVVAVDEGSSYCVLVGSANLEDAGLYFSDTALVVRDQSVARHFVEAERAVAEVSGCQIPALVPPCEDRGDARVTPLLGADIRRAVLADLAAVGAGDRVWVLMLFLAERRVIRALIAAARRGAEIRVVLDQNRVSFGEKKSGFPNQYVAPELVREGIKVRWANSPNEEFHSKLMLIERARDCVLHAGSANFTRRSLSNTNLEANLRVEAPCSAGVCVDARRYVAWLFRHPRSLPYSAGHHPHTRAGYWLYRVQEATGTSSW